MNSRLAGSAPQSVLFLFSHNDDEFFVLPRLEREVAEGNEVLCVYTTDGAAYDECPTRRLKESYAVLSPRGVPTENIIPLGTQRGIRDGTSFRSLAGLWQQLRLVTQGKRFSRIYTPAWEGGHADHDAAHLLAVALARCHGSEVYEFSLYHSLGAVGPIISAMSLIPLSGTIVHEPVTLRGALSWLLAFRHYRTQRRAFLGLLPLSLPQILLRRALPLRRVENRNYRCRPHSGPMFYETRFKVPYDEFYSATRAFIEMHIDPVSLQDASGF